MGLFFVSISMAYLIYQEISVSFADFEKANINNNRIAMQVAEFTYNKYVMSEWGSQICCFHPRDLQDLHKRAVDAALNQFMVNRSHSEVDDFKTEMVKASSINSYLGSFHINMVFYTQKEYS